MLSFPDLVINTSKQPYSHLFNHQIVHKLCMLLEIRKLRKKKSYDFLKHHLTCKLKAISPSFCLSSHSYMTRVPSAHPPISNVVWCDISSAVDCSFTSVSRSIIEPHTQSTSNAWREITNTSEINFWEYLQE